jgi:hypothetical protein
MLSRFLTGFPAAFAAALMTVAAAAYDRQAPAPPAPRIVAIGDIHGSLSGLQQILRAAALVDDKQRWSGGTARLVQTGDFTDRGDHVREVMDLLMRLEGEARRAGGRVDVLFGNHEGMNVLHDLRDVSPGAFAKFADQRSEDRRRRAFDAHAEIAKRAGVALARDEWMAAHPPGYVEYVQALGPSGQYGRWIRARKPVLQIGDAIFMHAGLHPQGTATVDDTNRLVEREVKTWDELLATMERAKLITGAFTLQEVINVAQVEIGRIAIAQKTSEPLPEHVTREYVTQLVQLQTFPKWALIDENGPLWYRGYASPGDEPLAGFDGLLTRLGVRRFVTGHTPQLPGGKITSRWGGKAILIDTGMLSSHYKGGQPSALEIHQGRLTAIYANGREPLGGDK